MPTGLHFAPDGFCAEMTGAESLWQRPSGLKSLKYLLTGSSEQNVPAPVQTKVQNQFSLHTPLKKNEHFCFYILNIIFAIKLNGRK